MEITKSDAEAFLRKLGVVDKKSYRMKALALHPDRNGGDGAKMSELNMYWQVYNA